MTNYWPLNIGTPVSLGTSPWVFPPSVSGADAPLAEWSATGFSRYSSPLLFPVSFSSQAPTSQAITQLLVTMEVQGFYDAPAHVNTIVQFTDVSGKRKYAAQPSSDYWTKGPMTISLIIDLPTSAIPITDQYGISLYVMDEGYAAIQILSIQATLVESTDALLSKPFGFTQTLHLPDIVGDDTYWVDAPVLNVRQTLNFLPQVLTDLQPELGQHYHFVEWVDDPRGVNNDGQFTQVQTFPVGSYPEGGYRVLNFAPSIEAQGLDPNLLITGIEIEVERYCTNVIQAITTDQYAILQRNYQDAGENKASNTHWSESKQVIVYGGPDDTWGLGQIVLGDLIDAGFGFRLKADFQSADLPVTQYGFIDYIKLSLYYSESTAAELHIPVQMTQNTLLPYVL